MGPIDARLLDELRHHSGPHPGLVAYADGTAAVVADSRAVTKGQVVFTAWALGNVDPGVDDDNLLRMINEVAAGESAIQRIDWVRPLKG